MYARYYQSFPLNRNTFLRARWVMHDNVPTPHLNNTVIYISISPKKKQKKKRTATMKNSYS